MVIGKGGYATFNLEDVVVNFNDSGIVNQLKALKPLFVDKAPIYIKNFNFKKDGETAYLNAMIVSYKESYGTIRLNGIGHVNYTDIEGLCNVSLEYNPTTDRVTHVKVVTFGNETIVNY